MGGKAGEQWGEERGRGSSRAQRGEGQVQLLLDNMCLDKRPRDVVGICVLRFRG